MKRIKSGVVVSKSGEFHVSQLARMARGTEWAAEVMKSVSSQVEKGPGMSVGAHCHYLVRMERQTMVDGCHEHAFIVPSISGQVVVLFADYGGGVHKHKIDELADTSTDDSGEHKHIVRCPVDLMLPDGTQVKAGEIFLTEMGGSHSHGANSVHWTDGDGAHFHELVIGDLTIESMGIPELVALMGNELPLLKAHLSPEKELAAAIMGMELSKAVPSEDIQDLIFDEEVFDRADVLEWLSENGFETSVVVQEASGGFLVSLSPSTDFDQDTVRRIDISEGVEAMAGTRKVEKQTEIQTLIFPKERFTEAEAKRWAKDNGYRSAGVDETGSSYRIRQESPEKYVRLRTISLPGGGGIKAVVGVKKQADEQEFRDVGIAKADDEKMIVYGVVLEPDTVDLQGDMISAAEIEETAHGYMSKARVVKFRHGKVIHDAYPVESFIAPDDLTYDGPNGKQKVRKGSWVLGVKTESKQLWKAIKKKEINAFSVGGTGKREPLP